MKPAHLAAGLLFLSTSAIVRYQFHSPIPDSIIQNNLHDAPQDNQPDILGDALENSRNLIFKFKERIQNNHNRQDVASFSVINDTEVPRAGMGMLPPEPYNIWTRNCHTAANKFICATNDKSRVGVVACRGADSPNRIGGHTPNWIVLSKGQTCIYNWGRSCCWNAMETPPNIASGEGKKCAETACGKQYCTETSCMSAGEYVEWPDTGICSLVAAGGKPNHPEYLELDFNPGKKEECLRCCDSRADHWPNKEPWLSNKRREFENQRKEFRLKCQNGCRNIFR